jgi:hypothetical protein
MDDYEDDDDDDFIARKGEKFALIIGNTNYSPSR